VVSQCRYLLSPFQIPPSVLEQTLVHVEQGYASNGNPYHNNMHACDVLQTVNYFISQTGLEVKCGFSVETKFASLASRARSTFIK